MTTILLAPLLLLGADPTAATDTPGAVEVPPHLIKFELVDENKPPPIEHEPGYTGRFTSDELRPLIIERTDLLPLPLQFESQRRQCLDALDRISMEALLEELMPFLASEFEGRFDRKRDVILVPVSPDRQVTLRAPTLPDGQYHGPDKEIAGFLLHGIDEETYVRVAIRILQTARKLLDSGDPAVDRSSDSYDALAAERRLQAIVQAAEEAEAESTATLAIRRRIGEDLGVYDDTGGVNESAAAWVKESRRFSYVVQKGAFIDKLKPLVDRINLEIEMAGFASPSLIDAPGIHFDPDLGDVEILLPRQMLEEFLAQADALEQRMAEDSMITVEMVRLTDREIIDGVVAARLNGQVQGVHDSNRPTRDAIIRQAGINALTAVANRELQIATIEGVAGGTLPPGTEPLTVPPITLEPLEAAARNTTLIGSTFGIGADSAFFDGREQSYGFSYVGPDGIEHRLSLDIADFLRQVWERIERNLIVHKIKKTPTMELYSVPVGPKEKTFEGIAALISQENQEQVVATGTGALSELSATAGTWLVIRDFEITPIPGSSTALTEDERKEITERVTMTMFLRDPMVNIATKRELVEIDRRPLLTRRLDALRAEHNERPIRGGRDARTFGAVLERRIRETLADAAIEKKEQNSKITLTFYSSQGTILPQVVLTALGDANDLTSFTTQLTPNKVTPISSFFTKTAGGTEDKSQITGLPRGEKETKDRTMTHLVVRARFPTDERERKDTDEGRYLGYFDLPMGREPLSMVNLPFLSSSEHPLDRLAQIRVGRMFAALDGSRVRERFSLLNPQQKVGDVPQQVWEACTTRLLMTQRIVTDAGTDNPAVAAAYRRRFDLEVRTLLEYDEDFFDAPNIALRNMAQWNDPQRIVLALQNSADRFPLERMIAITDEMGERLVPREFVDDRMAVSSTDFWNHVRIRPLDDDQIHDLRRDVALHCMRREEMFGDAFLEAMSLILGLGRYTSLEYEEVTAGPFHGYLWLVLFDGLPARQAQDSVTASAHEQFLYLRTGGHRGKLFQPSMEFLSHLASEHRALVIVGKEILSHHQLRPEDSYDQE